MTVNWVFDDTSNYRTMTACPNTVIGDDFSLEDGRFPVANFFWYWRWAVFEDKTGTHGWSMHGLGDRPSKYAYNIGLWTSPGLWAGWEGNGYGYQNLFQYVPQGVMEDARSGRALLVLDNLNEGFQDHLLYRFWHDSCQRYNIPPSSVVFLTSNLLDEQGYRGWAAANGVIDTIHVIGFCHLEYQQINCLSTTYANLSWEDHEKAKSGNNLGIKLFNCLNRVQRPHREFLMLRLVESDLHHRGLISHDRLTMNNWESNGFSKDTIKRTSELLPLVVDDADFGNNKAMQINPDIYLRSWMSIVTETHAFDDAHSLFISEKPWKPVYALHPFMILGHRDSLAAIRSMGYRTFDGLLDESYDSMHFIDRTSVILNNIRKLSVIRDRWGWLQECREIVEHNRKVFLAKQIFENDGVKRFVEIYEALPG